MSRSQTAEQRFDSRYAADPKTGCWNWTAGKGGGGYGQLRVHARMTLAHRYSFERFNGPIPSRALVCHHCDNPSCVNPEHLFAGTQQDNMADMHAKGRNGQPRGERSGRTKLRTADVVAINKLIGTHSNRKIAQMCGSTSGTVSNIARGKTWAWLTGREGLGG